MVTASPYFHKSFQPHCVPGPRCTCLCPTCAEHGNPKLQTTPDKDSQYKISHIQAENLIVQTTARTLLGVREGDTIAFHKASILSHPWDLFALSSPLLNCLKHFKREIVIKSPQPSSQTRPPSEHQERVVWHWYRYPRQEDLAWLWAFHLPKLEGQKSPKSTRQWTCVGLW